MTSSVSLQVEDGPLLSSVEAKGTHIGMTERMEAQKAPACQLEKDPRTQQDGERGTRRMAEIHRAASWHLDGDLHCMAEPDRPTRPASTHRSDSAGAAFQKEPDEPRPASSSAALRDRFNQHEELCGSLHRQEIADLSRCGTPDQGMQGIDGPLSSPAQGYAVPFPNSSTIGLSPRRPKPPPQAAESSRSEDSSANPGDFLATESPPWSPRRVPPAHLWGEGPPRYPGYRSGGATLPDAPQGVSADDLQDAACELQALLRHRASLGLRPLLHAQPFFSADSAPGEGRHSGGCATFQGPPTPILQATPSQGRPPQETLHAGHEMTIGTLCAEGAVLSPVPMQLPAGGTFPAPCMWDLTNVQLNPLLPADGVGACAEEVGSSHGASIHHQMDSAVVAPTTTAESMGISPAVPCKSSRQPKQAQGPEGGPATPVNAEKDKAGGSKRSAAEDAATSEQPAGAARKPRRATKRRLF